MKKAVIAYLNENGANEPALSDLMRENEYLICPVCDGDNIGFALIPTDEGILCLSYNSVDPEVYEVFDTENAKLLSADEFNEKFELWKAYKDRLDNSFDCMCASVKVK